MATSELTKELVKELELHKADNVSIYKNNKIAEHIIVVSCESNKHGKALAAYVMKSLKKNRLKYRTNGIKDANWIVIDINEIIVHIFRFDVREYYQVDELWA